MSLIVEDNAFDSRKMARVLHNAGVPWRVEVAGTLRAARKAVSQGNIALILLDNNLPDGLGADFALELAANPDTARIPVVMVSDWPSPFMWEKAASAGVNHVLSKSEFHPRHISDVLRNGAAQRLA